MIGCAIAREVSRRGMSVAVIERDGVAANASGFAWGGLAANYGVGVPGPMLKHYKRAIEMHKELYDALKSDTSHDWGLTPITTMSLARDESALAELRSDVEWMKSEDFKAEVIDENEVYRLEPGIAPGMIGASMSYSQWELDCVSYSNALLEDAIQHGASLVQGEVVEVASRSDQIEGVVLSDGTSYSVGTVVLSTGPWGGGIKGVPDLPIRPVKGEILRLDRPGDDLQIRVGFDGLNAGRKPDGLVWVGTYEWDRSYNRESTKEGRDFILGAVGRYLPALVSAPIKIATACLRPVSDDGLPLLGGLGGLDGLYCANGGSKKGVLLSLLIARTVADSMFDGIEIPLEMSTARVGLA